MFFLTFFSCFFCSSFFFSPCFFFSNFRCSRIKFSGKMHFTTVSALHSVRMAQTADFCDFHVTFKYINLAIRTVLKTLRFLVLAGENDQHVNVQTSHVCTCVNILLLKLKQSRIHCTK